MGRVNGGVEGKGETEETTNVEEMSAESVKPLPLSPLLQAGGESGGCGLG